jgi:tripartite-type tricarboxylate transporter receptor subunit TctC
MRRYIESLIFLQLAVLFALIAAGSICRAEGADWPDRDIILIVPYAAGGGYDVVARATAPYIQRHLPKKANVVVKNVPGAGGKIGFMELVRAKPDGHTIAVLDPADVAVLQVSGQLEGMDILKLSWLGRLDRLPDLLTAGAKSGFKTPADMKGKPVRFAAIGAGVTFRSAVIAKAIGADARFISYDGTSPASIAAMQGDIDAFVVNWVSATRMAAISEGRLIPMFVAASERISDIKEIPCARDLGIDLEESVLGYSHILTAPAGLPDSLKKAWEETLARTFSDPGWTAQMNRVKYPPSPLTGGELDAGIRRTLKATGGLKDIISGIGMR